ncbi:MAG: hypothetical protein LC789_11120 [Actinobacteria bacterium]|nr:hypothetical protein [Actinomycetota bacterium]MCA1720670.1 hypothetical protein [Actinomycetota bacterium]
MPSLSVRTDELAACGAELTQSARLFIDVVAAFDTRSADGLLLEHPVAVEAYERFFGAWSIRLHEAAEVLDGGAHAVVVAAERYAAWDRYVAGLAT